MKAQITFATAMIALVFGYLGPFVAAGEKEKAPAAPAVDGSYDFAFLTDAGPLLIRVHPYVNGKPVHRAWNDFMGHLFRHLDVNGDGVLSEQEAERAPPLDQILGGITGSAIPGMGMGMAAKPAPTLRDLDAGKDGKVTLVELSAYYMHEGFSPFQLESDAKAPEESAYGMAMMMGGQKREPGHQEIGMAVFNLLDADHDGKLSKAELAAAVNVLLKFDTSEEDIVTGKQLHAGFLSRKGAGKSDTSYQSMIDSLKNIAKKTKQKDGPAEAKQVPPPPPPVKVVASASKMMIPLPVRGEAPAQLSERMKTLYPNGAPASEFVKRPPDLELAVHLGTAGGKGRLEVIQPKVGKFKTMPGLVLLDQGSARTELRVVDAAQDDVLGAIVSQQASVQFKAVDRKGKGYVTEKEAAGNPLLARSFKAMDRDGDGKVTEAEFTAYLELLQDLKTRASQACVSVSFTDLSASLFELLDVNRDGRLCVRALRDAPALMEKYGRNGALTRAELPHGYRLTVRRGPAKSSNDPFSAILSQLYGIGAPTNEPRELTDGPVWFRKMDRNRDGDVSRREWLGSEERFRQIDADGDGLISAAEAQRYDERERKGGR